MQTGADALTGRAIAHYQILEKLGEGGMGVVYTTRDTHLDRVVAIKVLPPERVLDPHSRRRFVLEGRAASALNHPGIVTVRSDGNLMDFTSDRDGFRCIWAQRLDPGTKRPVDAPLPIYHSHSARRSLLNADILPLELQVAPGRLLFHLGEITGNIWMAEWKPR